MNTQLCNDDCNWVDFVGNLYDEDDEDHDNDDDEDEEVQTSLASGDSLPDREQRKEDPHTVRHVPQQ